MSLKLSSVIVVALLCGSTGCTTATLGKVLRDKYNLSELVPPSKYAVPGAVLKVNKDSAYQTAYLCFVEDSLGRGFAPRPSDTSTFALRNEIEGTYGLSAQLVNDIKASAKLKRLKKVTLRIARPKLLAVSDAEVVRAQANRSSECERVIHRALKNGETVSMIRTALEADFSYQVEFQDSNNLGAEAKRELLSELAAKLGVDSSSIGEESIQGRGLFWGVQDDLNLVEDTLAAHQTTGGSSGSTPRQTASHSIRRAVPAEERVLVSLPAYGEGTPDSAMDKLIHGATGAASGAPKPPHYKAKTKKTNKPD